MRLLEALEEYLALRRALGFILDAPCRALHSFVAYAEHEGAFSITTDLALKWAMQPDCQPAQWANRLSMVRRFARYMSALDARTEIPPDGLLPHRFRRKSPYIYTEEEITHLIGAAQNLPVTPGPEGSHVLHLARAPCGHRHAGERTRCP